MTGQKKGFAKSVIRLLGALGIVLSMIAEATAGEVVRINFRDADIRSVIESVAEITGKSFVLDPRVKGKVTIIAPEAIDSDLGRSVDDSDNALVSQQKEEPFSYPPGGPCRPPKTAHFRFPGPSSQV